MRGRLRRGSRAPGGFSKGFCRRGVDLSPGTGSCSSRRAGSSSRPSLDGDIAIEVRTGPPLPGTLWLQTPRGRERRGAPAPTSFSEPSPSSRLSRPSLRSPLVHDLTPLLFPEWHSCEEPAGLHAVHRRGRPAGEADRDGLGRHARRPRRLVPGGGREDGRRSERRRPAPSRIRGGPPPNEGRPYVLFLGTLEPRKNVRAAGRRPWRRSGTGGPTSPTSSSLAATGGASGVSPGSSPARGTPRRIRAIGWTTPVESARLIRHARLLAYPSLYEGFGLPPLEAMALGTPVVGSSSSSLPEVIGDAGLLPDPGSVAAIAAALLKANDDEPWRAAARRRGIERAAAFTWEASAARLRAVCEEALR